MNLAETIKSVCRKAGVLPREVVLFGEQPTLGHGPEMGARPDNYLPDCSGGPNCGIPFVPMYLHEDEGCTGGYWGCRDTIQVSHVFAGAGTEDVEVKAPIEALPLAFVYTGATGLFSMGAPRSGNAGITHTGAARSADGMRFDIDGDKRVNWPAFSGATPLIIPVTATGAGTFEGILFCRSAHRRG